MKIKYKKRIVLNFFVSFLGFFLLAEFYTIVSVLIIFKMRDIPFDSIFESIPIAFLNLFIISFVFGIMATVWKSITVERPVNRINDALVAITKGNYSVKMDEKYYTPRFSTIVKNINLMTNELTSLNGLKVSLMSNISHELKTPLSVISNYSTLLQDPNLSQNEVDEYSKIVFDHTKKMTELISNILKINQLENQNIPTENIHYNLSEQICECLLNFENIWEAKKIEIETNIEDYVFVDGDFQLLEIVWNNLLGNAFKFTQDNGKVTVSVSEGINNITVTIEDTGCGIPSDKINYIFEKFYQCDSSRGTDGYGLGLALVKRIISITNGLIYVDSTVGVGTKFKIKIPKHKE